ncbi:MAG TPA: sugar transferase [Acidobacteriaceae bacterium]|nr:sugar transferase [Acidobacteriaceae bacterium]
MSRRRRIVEFVVAAAALVALMPLMAVVAALIWLDSGGPVLFRQKRMGGNGREFTLCKFRSMRKARDRNSCITVSGDSRITRVGAFLRRYKLDELPQFWNVLRGDMSLVGPRPKLPHLEPLHMTYRPGITGAATLAFRNEEEFLAGIPEVEVEAFYEMFVKPAKAQLDFDYMRRATFLSDIAILSQTLTSCVSSPPQSVTLAAEVVARYAAEWNGATAS